MASARQTFRLGWAAVCVPLAAIAGDPRPERARLVAVLVQTLDQERGWPRIHAAEALIEHGSVGRVYDVFAGNADTAAPPERIGVWRVLARSAPTAARRQEYVERIRRAAVDPAGPDRVHAVESLAKLGAYQETDRPAIEAMAAGDPAVAAFPRWYLALPGRPADEARLVELLDSPDAVARQRAAYAVARLKEPSAAARTAVAARAGREPRDSPARVALVSAAYLTSDDAGRERWRAILLDALAAGPATDRTAAADALGRRGTPADLAALAPATASPDGSLRASASSASLHILRRVPSTDLKGVRE